MFGSSESKSACPARRLELEITEPEILQENEHVLEIMRQFRDLGIKITIDDFGTGYSSLSYLRSFPFDKIKIDQSFIRELPEKKGSRAIVRAVVGLSTSLGITTVAEGVETEQQLASVIAKGCDQFQGHLFCAALPAKDIERILGERIPQATAVA